MDGNRKPERQRKRGVRPAQPTDPPDWLLALKRILRATSGVFSGLTSVRLSSRRSISLVLLFAMIAAPVAVLIVKPGFTARLNLSIEVARP
jgi:hypothetical protein